MMIKFKFYYAKVINKYNSDTDMMHKRKWAMYRHKTRENTTTHRDKLHCNHIDNLLDIDK